MRRRIIKKRCQRASRRSHQKTSRSRDVHNWATLMKVSCMPFWPRRWRTAFREYIDFQIGSVNEGKLDRVKLWAKAGLRQPPYENIHEKVVDWVKFMEGVTK